MYGEAISLMCMDVCIVRMNACMYLCMYVSRVSSKIVKRLENMLVDRRASVEDSKVILRGLQYLREVCMYVQVEGWMIMP